MEKPPATTSRPPAKRRTGILLIAIFKLFQGVLLLVISLGVMHLLQRHTRHVLEQYINLVRVDPENRYVAALLARFGLVDDRRLKELSGLAAIYGALFLTEGTGLLLRQRWAEYLTVIATGSLIPLEIYEIFRHCTPSRFVLLLGNAAILVYLIGQLRQEREA